MHTEKIINDVDWESYRASIIQLAIEAIEKYLETSTEKIYQIWIWTDIYAQIAQINFETLDHAMQSLLGGEQPLTPEELTQFRPSSVGVIINGTTDMLFYGFLSITTPQLAPIQDLDCTDDNVEAQVYARFESELLAAIKSLIDDGVFRRLPHEEYVWISANSIQDWFDHTKYVKLE